METMVGCKQLGLFRSFDRRGTGTSGGTLGKMGVVNAGYICQRWEGESKWKEAGKHRL